MPELPEVRAHAERLAAAFDGAVLRRFEALSFTALKTYAPEPGAALDRPVTAVRSRGKLLLVELAPVTFVVHLMQGGRLRPDDKQARKVKGGLARWTFDDGRALLLTEAGTDRKAGVWVRDGDHETQEPLSGLGPDADRVDAARLHEIVRSSANRRLHTWLRDQDGVAGLGRRLANEVCWQARLSPFASIAKLDDDEIDRLHAAIGVAVGESLAAERERDDMSASKDRPGAVHHRVGLDCVRCGDTIRSVEYRDYTVAYCPTCQTGGKVLADNTTSKFLR